MSSPFITAKEAGELLGVSRTSAYRIVHQLNEELKEKGYIIVRGKVAKEYFFKRLNIREVK